MRHVLTPSHGPARDLAGALEHDDRELTRGVALVLREVRHLRRHLLEKTLPLSALGNRSARGECFLADFDRDLWVGTQVVEPVGMRRRATLGGDHNEATIVAG